MDDVIRIEQHFGVSHQAAVYRLMGTRHLDQAVGESFLNQAVRARAKLMGYSSSLYYPTPQSKQYMTYGSNIRQISEALNRNLISYGKYEELLMDAYRADLVYGTDDETGGVVD